MTLTLVPDDKPGFAPGETARQVERHRANGWRDLDPVKRMFAIEYSSCLSHTHAAKAIGRAGQGLKFLRDPLVLALIADLQDEHHQYNIITEQWIRHKLVELLPKVMGEEDIPVVLASGETIHTKKFHPSESKSVLEALGNSLKREHGVNVNVSGEVSHVHQDAISVKDIETLFEKISGSVDPPESSASDYLTLEGEVVVEAPIEPEEDV